MATAVLYPWYVKSNIYSLRGFDKSWFEETTDGLSPKHASAEIFCLGTLHSWDFFCELPHPIATESVTLQMPDGRPPRKSETAVPQFISGSCGGDGHWQGNAYFEIFARSSLAEAFIAKEESYWAELPNVELRKTVKDVAFMSKSVSSDPAMAHPYDLKYEIAYSLFKVGGCIPNEWGINESLFNTHNDAIPILDVWASAT